MAQLAEPRAEHRRLVAGQVEKLAEGRDVLTRALEADLNKLADSRAASTDWSPARSRSSPKAATSWRAPWKTICARSTRAAPPSTCRVGAGRQARRRTQLADPSARADLEKLADVRSGIDSAIAGHVGKLSESRGMLTRALEDDLRRLSDTRADIDGAVVAHIQTLADRRSDISEALAADVEQIEDAFRRQTGVIEERTGTMERGAGRRHRQRPPRAGAQRRRRRHDLARPRA